MLAFVDTQPIRYKINSTNVHFDAEERGSEEDWS